MLPSIFLQPPNLLALNGQAWGTQDRTLDPQSLNPRNNSCHNSNYEVVRELGVVVSAPNKINVGIISLLVP